MVNCIFAIMRVDTEVHVEPFGLWNNIRVKVDPVFGFAGRETSRKENGCSSQEISGLLNQARVRVEEIKEHWRVAFVFGEILFPHFKVDI